MAYSIMIADDHEVVRSGLRSLLAGTDFTIAAEAASLAETLEKLPAAAPQALLLDIRLGGESGFTVLEQLRREQSPVGVLMLTAHDNPLFVQRAMSAGANGYLLKGCSRAQILSGLRTVCGGGNTWTLEEQRRVQGALVTPRLRQDLDAPLTEREAEVLREVVSGHTNQHIAKSLSISVETVKEHIQHILRKIGVTDRTQAAVWAVRNSVVD